MVWLKFILCLVVILFAGTKLARYGDALAEKTGLGRVWVGLLFVAVVTSMPELVTAVSAAALVKVPDLALGTLLGSCLYNLTILGILDIIYRGTPILSQVSRGHVASTGMEIVLIVLAGGSILTMAVFPGFSLGWVGIPGIIIFVLYLFGARQLYRLGQEQPAPLTPVEPLTYAELPTGTVYLRFTLASVAVIATGIWLSFIGDEISVVTGWGASFVGNLFLAITTSLPELVVALAAVRLGAADLALADILGANMLDIVAILWVDLFYTSGPILTDVSQAHLIPVVLTLLMSLLVVAGLLIKQKRKTFIVTSWYGPLFIALYFIGAYLLFISGIGLG